MQTKLASAVEAVVNTTVGAVIAIGANYLLFWVYEVKASNSQVLHVAGWMTVISVVRSYVIRRAWNSEFWKRVKR